MCEVASSSPINHWYDPITSRLNSIGKVLVPPADQKVVSFSQHAFLALFSSDILNPSNCVLRPLPDKGSIAKTLQAAASADENFDLIETQPVTTLWHRFGKIPRAAARAVTACAIGLIIAPAGAVWNLGGASYYAGKAVVLRVNGEANDAAWERAAQYGKAFFADFCVGAITYAFTTLSTVGAWVLFGGGTSIAGFTAVEIGIAKVGGGALLFSNLVALGAAIAPEWTISLFAYAQERAPLFKAVTLRNELGLVDETKSLLTASAPDDTDCIWEGVGNRVGRFQGHFYDLWKKEQQEVNRLVSDAIGQDWFPVDPRSLSPIGSNYSGSQFLRVLREENERNPQQPNANVTELARQIQKHQNRVYFLKDFIERSSKVAGDVGIFQQVLTGENITYTFPDFPS